MKNLRITVNGTTYDVQVEEVNGAVAPVAAAPAPAAAGSTTVESPMPGTILAVNVTPGQAVKRGDVLLVLEAMKMENEIKAPADGTVASINVNKGETVDSGQTLVTLS
ncbi:MAG: biotin/lipoyl-containing protein [Eubacteriales bacterium]|nr:biotin/lipoyl-containing protein [Eubacteriales bacterium]